MDRITDRNLLDELISESSCKSIIRALDAELFVTQYRKGELVNSPLDNNSLFQIISSGAVSIYLIRNDGSSYALAEGRKDYILGDMELFSEHGKSIFAEASEDLTCIAFSIEKNIGKVTSDCSFMNLICRSLSSKIAAMTELEASPSTLRERVLTYMAYKCRDKELKGIERTAFHLHCSARQLQRILSSLEKESVVEKIGKGTYRLM